MSKTVLAYHFTNGYHLRDGQLLETGREYVFDGEPVMYECGYHASRHVFDALKYAPGSILSRVECREVTEERDYKLVCRRRRVIATIDATELLRRFARLCALEVTHLWKAPDIVIRYLKTGDESLMEAAWSAAWSAAWDTSDAARAAAWSAAGDAVGDAAGDAARIAAMYAARIAASSAEAAARAAGAAASRAAWDTSDAARAAGVARDADAAMSAARSAACAAALDAARDDAMQGKRRRLARMVNQAFKEGEES